MAVGSIVALPAGALTMIARLFHAWERRLASVTTDRVVRPLGLFFWGRTWTVAAWCELRDDHRSFRIDRITRIDTLDDTFADEPPFTLDDFMVAVRERDAEQAGA